MFISLAIDIHMCVHMVILLELIIINYNMYELIYNKYILYNGLSNYTRYEVIKFCIGFNMCHEKWII
jgi:hypothetical protein